MNKIIITFLYAINIITFSQNIFAEDVQDNTNSGNNRKIGMYIEGEFTGGLNASVGLGFTFFNEMLKLQINIFPFVPKGSISDVNGGGVGIKIIGAYNFTNSSIGLGAGFTNFFMNKYYPTPSAFFQWEFMKIDISDHYQNRNKSRLFSLFLEPHVYFIPINDDNEQLTWSISPTVGLGFKASL